MSEFDTFLIKEDQMSNRKIYRIKLTAEERAAFGEIIKGKPGKVKIACWKVQRANAMLKCDESEHGPAWPDETTSLVTLRPNVSHWSATI